MRSKIPRTQLKFFQFTLSDLLGFIQLPVQMFPEAISGGGVNNERFFIYLFVGQYYKKSLKKQKKTSLFYHQHCLCVHMQSFLVSVFNETLHAPIESILRR